MRVVTIVANLRRILLIGPRGGGQDGKSDASGTVIDRIQDILSINREIECFTHAIVI
ncbi:Uncharacterised protein [Vibrio cholerae]|nr:Uncharacterised protein [Vibrio cholerae]CSI67375.1 Uncharacterised protein [Vibrio cholerae]